MSKIKRSLVLLALVLSTAVLFAGQIITDNFNRANANDLGSEWTNLNTGGERLRVDTNVASMSNGGLGEGLAYYSGAGWTGGEDQYSEAGISVLQSGKDLAPACRVSGTTVANANAYLYDINDTDAAVSLGSSISTALYKQVSGAFTQIGSRDRKSVV